jgi:hypothetical protein
MYLSDVLDCFAATKLVLMGLPRSPTARASSRQKSSTLRTCCIITISGLLFVKWQ